VPVQHPIELVDREHVVQVTLVVLDDVRKIDECAPVLFEVLAQVLVGFDVRVAPARLGIGHEHEPVGTGENQLAGRVVVDLAGHGEKLKPHVHVANARKANRQKIEIEGAVHRRGERDHLAPVLRADRRVDMLQRRRLAAQARAVIDDLEDELPRQGIDGRHLGARDYHQLTDARTPAKNADLAPCPGNAYTELDLFEGPEPMITITEKAADKVKEIADAEALQGQGLRLRVVGGGCSGFSYDLYFEDQPTDMDETFQANGVNLYIDPLSFQYLDGTEIDYVEGLHGSGFKFNNPNVKGTCGCGSSFSA
jgi:iron-sulfur cluster insertion protein